VLFNSIDFLIFFPLVTTLYFVVAHRYRWFLLLAASCYFYMSFIPIYILVLAATIIIDYFAGIVIEDASPRLRKASLIASIVATCSVLFVFKYFNFFRDNINELLPWFGSESTLSALNLILPIGLSFHTFQSLSYVIEVYRGNQRAERHFGIYALYVMFYPQLVAGPIERPQNLLHQFREEHHFSYDNARNGLRLMLWGLFKKVVVADRLAIYVDSVYNNVPDHSGPTLVLATVFFAFQIYCDFSGYSDIAIGAAKVMGFDLMTNFAKPYFSKSVSEFWRRWHISLSTWFRDYVYVPLGGSRVSPLRWCLNVLVTFTISGLWHGANWTFIVWGALNGMYLIAERVLGLWVAASTKRAASARWKPFVDSLKLLATFGLICVAWVFFRAHDLSDAVLVLAKIVSEPGPVFLGGARDIIYGVAGIAFVLCVDVWGGRARFDQALSAYSMPVRWATYATLMVGILAIGVFDGSQFIYFQF
jgi:D-alanyl-lipoteichoic acid acyltransferase DltB (MBOAT superfamily)